MPFRKNRLRPRAGYADAGSVLHLHARSSGQPALITFNVPEEGGSNVDKGLTDIGEVQLNDGQIAQLEAHPAHLLPSIAAASEVARIERFRRTICAGLHQHSLIVTTVTSGLLVTLLFVESLNPAFYFGVTGYLLGTYTSAIVFGHAIRYATHRDELETISEP